MISIICRDMLGRARLHVGLQAAQRLHVGLKDPVGFLGQFANGDAALGGPGVDLVVDVGDVAHIAHMLRAIDMPQQPIKHVEHDNRPRIADVREIIDRRPAHINAHIGRIERDERFLPARERIVKFERRRRRHGASLKGPPAGRRFMWG